jgi:ABC-2 type transport system permease protein
MAHLNADVSTIQRLRTPMAMFLREYYRNTINLVLLAIIPVLLIYTFGDALGRLSDLFGQFLTLEMGKSMGALWAAAFLTGITGFFMMIGAQSADRRLVRAGYSPVTVVVLRAAAVGVIGGIVSLVSYGVLLTQLTPVNYLQALVVIYLGALIYGAIGILIGSIIHSELEGSFALLFFFVMDAFIGSPLFGATAQAFVFLPTHYPTKILLSLTAGEAHASIHWLYVALYLTVVSILAGIAFYRAARVR